MLRAAERHARWFAASVDVAIDADDDVGALRQRVDAGGQPGGRSASRSRPARSWCPVAWPRSVGMTSSDSGCRMRAAPTRCAPRTTRRIRLSAQRNGRAGRDGAGRHMHAEEHQVVSRRLRGHPVGPERPMRLSRVGPGNRDGFAHFLQRHPPAEVGTSPVITGMKLSRANCSSPSPEYSWICTARG
jgi:hypothetical protein